MTLYQILSIIGFPTLFSLIYVIWKQLKTMERGIQALLRDRLYQMSDKGTERGFAPREIKDNFENIYKWYHTLGQNGVMDIIHDNFLRLPDKPKESEE